MKELLEVIMRTFRPLAVCFFILLIGNCRSSSYLLSERSTAQSAQKADQGNPAPAPCEFFDPLRDPNNERLKRKYLIQIEGYSKEITVREAIEQFNERARCHNVGKTQPPMTETEFLTAVLDIPGEDAKPSAIEKEYLHQVFEKRTLPKGSLIDFSSGLSSPKYDITYWKIYLRFDLHTHPRVPDDLVDPKSVRHDFTIRRQYISY